MLDFDPEPEYDVSICHTVLMHLKDPCSITRRLEGACRAGGLFDLIARTTTGEREDPPT
jgi:2-polyprenyl-3-methyl-5-hydroxy-6-metoxy-1,4-benzoquinol methylase